MPSGGLLVGFIATALVVLLIPGPGVLYAVTRSAYHGYCAGLASVLGLSAGAFVHVVAAAVGISALLLVSSTAFNIIKLLGAGYLIYLGVKTLFWNRPSIKLRSAAQSSFNRYFIDGVIVSVFNPKIAIFFLSFLTQFVDYSIGNIPQQILILGMIYCSLALATDGAYALLAVKSRRLITGPTMRGPLPRYLTGGLYIGLGVNAAFAGRAELPNVIPNVVHQSKMQ